MDIITKEIYTTEVTVTGGRGGRALSNDKLIDIELARPGQGNATNPEQLLAAGWGACFQSALAIVGRRAKVSTKDSRVRVTVSLGATSSGVYAVRSLIEVHIPNVLCSDVQALAEETHTICPYSRATAGNIETTIRAVEEIGASVNS